MYLDFLEIPAILLDPFDGPGECLTERLAQYPNAGFADGRQTLQSPRTRTTLPSENRLHGSSGKWPRANNRFLSQWKSNSDWVLTIVTWAGAGFLM
ncbi:MAG TPA: hypothetical protein VJJ98_12960 [Sedimentisphaerales bacterium]|nr:hypothetical protein [Sedimentisphaerales bacterium]